MSPTAWTWDYEWAQDPPATRNGTATTLTIEPQLVQIKHVLGFAQPNWGEANWTAKDMR